MNSIEYITAAGIALATDMQTRIDMLKTENKRLLAELKVLQEAQIKGRQKEVDELDDLQARLTKLRKKIGQ